MTAALLIAALSTDVIDAVYTIDQLAGEMGWSRAQFEQELSLPMSRFFILKRDANILGYGGYWKVAPEAQITTLVIHPGERRKGHGRLLLKHLIEDARLNGCQSMTLEVRQRNTAAQTLYQTAGFIQQTVRIQAYSHPVDDAVLMEKTF